MKPTIYLTVYLAASLSATASAALSEQCADKIAECETECCMSPGCNCAVYTNRDNQNFDTYYRAKAWCNFSHCITEADDICQDGFDGKIMFPHNTSNQSAVATHEWDICKAWGCDLPSYEYAINCVRKLDVCTLQECTPSCKTETHACRLKYSCGENVYSRCLTDPDYAVCTNTEELCTAIFQPTTTTSPSSSDNLPAWLLIVLAVSVVSFLLVALTLCGIVRSWRRGKIQGVADKRAKDSLPPVKPVQEELKVIEHDQTKNPLEASADVIVTSPMDTVYSSVFPSVVQSVAQVSLGMKDEKTPEPQPLETSIQSVQSGLVASMQPDSSVIPTPDMLLNVKSDRSTFDKWQKSHMIGKGSFGEVYLGILHTGLFVAVKVVDLSKGVSEKSICDLLTEVSLMKDFSHTNITQYLDVEYDRHLVKLHIFMEFVDGGSLSSLVKRLPTYLDEALAKRYTIQLLEGLAYLHNMKVAHRDIKGENVLVRNDGVVKLADFGCSKKIQNACNNNKGCSTMVGTPYWMAPEVIGGDAIYGTASDVWSVGCTVSEMLNKGAPPWPIYPTMWAAIYHIASSTTLPTNLPTHVSEQATSFMHSCLVIQPEDRPSAKELIAHPFLVSVGKPSTSLPEPGNLFGE